MSGAAELRVAAALVHVHQGVEVVLWNLLAVAAEVAAAVELLLLARVAAPAGGRRHQHRDVGVGADQRLVLGGVGGVGRHLVAVDAGNPHMPVAAALPGADDAWVVLLVAFDAGLAEGRESAVDDDGLHLAQVAERLIGLLLTDRRLGLAGGLVHARGEHDGHQQREQDQAAGEEGIFVHRSAPVAGEGGSAAASLWWPTCGWQLTQVRSISPRKYGRWATKAGLLPRASSRSRWHMRQPESKT